MRSKNRIGIIICLLLTVVSIQCDVPDGYIINQANGRGYKLMYRAQPWNIAREMCIQDGAKLAVPKTEEEFTYLQQMVRAMHYPSIIGTKYKLLAWLGISNLENFRIWKNVDGENIEDAGYNTWCDHNGEGYSDDPAEPHCAGIDAVNKGLRHFWCDHSQPYICEINNTTH